MEDFRCVFKTCKASPKIMHACASGRHIENVIVSCRKSGAGAVDYLTFHMREVLISSYDTAGCSHDLIPLEQVTFNFAQDRNGLQGAAQGRLSSTGGIKKSWNLKENRGS